MLIPLKISVNLRIEGIMVGIYHCTCKCSNASMHVHACRNVVSNSWGNFDQFVCQLTIDINGIVIKDTVHVLSLILEIFSFSWGSWQWRFWRRLWRKRRSPPQVPRKQTWLMPLMTILECNRKTLKQIGFHIER